MSDLTGKFGGFEDQITSNHAEIMNALDTIATALGAPPPGPTTTLDDVVTALTQTNTTLAGIRSDMNTKLDYIFNTIDAMNNNASLNAQRILALMLQTACPCDATIPLLPPDLGTTPIDATATAKCQRIQYFIDLFRTWVINVGQYVGSQGSISSFQINSLMQSQLADRSITTGQLATGMPTSTRDQIASLLSSAVGSVGASTVDSELFNAMITANLETLRQSLYGTDNAVDGKDAFDAALNTISMTDWARTILVAMFYSSWANDIYSDTPIVDASAYDGTICAPADCSEYTSALRGDNYAIVHWADAYSDTSHTAGNWNGYSFRLVAISNIDSLSVTYYDTSGAFQGWVGGSEMSGAAVSEPGSGSWIVIGSWIVALTFLRGFSFDSVASNRVASFVKDVNVAPFIGRVLPGLVDTRLSVPGLAVPDLSYPARPAGLSRWNWHFPHGAVDNSR
jgi:hypothetical protein